MSAVGYDEYTYYMLRGVPDGVGGYTLDASGRDLERDFDGLRYKSFGPVGGYGDKKGVYSESYAEEDGDDVYMSSDVVRSSLEYKLELYFFCPDDSLTEYAARVNAAREVYEEFMDYVSGGMIVWWDTVRRRRVLMYLEEGVEPDDDVVCGEPYLGVALKFKGVFGRSFPLGDTTIAEYFGLSESDDLWAVLVG